VGPGGRCGEVLKAAIADGLKTYRKEYAEYYQSHAEPDSPAMRDDNPSIVLVPGIGMFSFGKSKPESRITGEFYTNAIHVMEGASAMGEGAPPSELPQAGPAAPTSAFKVHTNYVACRRLRLSGLSTGSWKRRRFAVSLRRSS
jgi:hypothetical protein